jgi:NAD(P)-dependent dehydrogenase (short-subunit alcohol dehydrogenase family)
VQVIQAYQGRAQREERDRLEQFESAMQAINVIPVPWIAPEDISRTVLYLASDDSRYVSGTTALIDLGAMQIS